MGAKQNEPSNSNIPLLYPIVITVGLIGLFLILTPKISARIAPFVSHSRVTEFLQDSKQTNRINPQLYWQTREFYSPGHFFFAKTGIEYSHVQEAVRKIGVPINDTKISTFLLFKSEKTNSIDALTTAKSLADIVPKLPAGEIVLNTNNEKIISDGNALYIFFLKPQDEMKTANRFYDYREMDVELLKDKQWFNATKILK